MTLRKCAYAWICIYIYISIHISIWRKAGVVGRNFWYICVSYEGKEICFPEQETREVPTAHTRTYMCAHIGHRNVEKHPPAASFSRSVSPLHVALTLMTRLFFRDSPRDRRKREGSKKGIFPAQLQEKKHSRRWQTSSCSNTGGWSFKAQLFSRRGSVFYRDGGRTRPFCVLITPWYLINGGGKGEAATEEWSSRQ